MQHSIHWDYADDFSGRDAAYLIAGFDPSSNSAEDAYRVQPIVQKLKEAYYYACEEIKSDVDYDDRPSGSGYGSIYNSLQRHRYPIKELLSVKLEGMIERFMSSPWVAGGHLKELQEMERFGVSFNEKHQFPEAQALRLADKKLDDARAALRSHWQRSYQVEFTQYLDIEQKLSEEDQKQKKHLITFNQYFVIKRDLEKQQDAIREILKEKTLADEPSLLENVKLARAQWLELSTREEDWNDTKTGEAEALDEKYAHLREAAHAEIDEWMSAYIHEFENQRFSRKELCRWLTDNKYPTAYSFGSKPLTDEKPLSTNERNTLLVLIAALCKKAGVDPAARGAAGELVQLARADGINVDIDPDTVRSKLKQIPDALGARGK